MVVANFESEADAVAEWHRLAGVVRGEGWDVDEAQVPVAFWFGNVRVGPRSAAGFDLSAVAFYVTSDGTHLILAVGTRGGFPELVEDGSLVVVNPGDPDRVEYLETAA